MRATLKHDTRRRGTLSGGVCTRWRYLRYLCRLLLVLGAEDTLCARVELRPWRCEMATSVPGWVGASSRALASLLLGFVMACGGPTDRGDDASTDGDARTSDSGVVCASDAECDDGLFCNGLETCVNGTCVDGADPCGVDETCNETTNSCDPGPCTSNAQCDNGVFCDGNETCVSGTCQPGHDPMLKRRGGADV